MIELFRDPSYNFIGQRRRAYVVSTLGLLISVASLTITGGMRYGIDFAGGTLVQLRFAEAPSIDRIRAALARGDLGDGIIQEYGDPREFVVRLPLSERVPEDVGAQVQGALAADPSLGPTQIERVEFVGPQAGRDLQWQAVQAIMWSVVGILLYIALRFDVAGGVAAVVAIAHDVLVCLGALSLTNRELTLSVLAALLTIIGYSVNDTIVAYDRVRENRRARATRTEPFAVEMNRAINQTLSRTVLTALTTFFVTLLLFLVGGPGLEDFAFVLTVGVVTGTYSTVYIAGSLIVDWKAWRDRRAGTTPGRAPARDIPGPTRPPGGLTAGRSGGGDRDR
jgi:preprotein translocase subunit SecF